MCIILKNRYNNMDVFQLLGDFLHLVAVLLLLLKIIASKNVVGLSYKTQELYLAVFVTRYSDMFLEHHWGSLYFNLMRFIFIGITVYTIYHMKFKRPYKLVRFLSIFRAMIMRLIDSHTTTFIWLLWFLVSSFIRNGPFMEYLNHFHGGYKLLRFCPSSI